MRDRLRRGTGIAGQDRRWVHALCLAVLLPCLWLASCASVPERGFDVRAPFCRPAFPDNDGWYGGDGAYSVTFKDGRTLWLFGDTFVSDDRGRKDRIDMDLVLGTTLATSTCDAQGRFFIRYHLKRRGEAFVSSFGDGGDWLWPQDPFLVEGTLYIPLIAVRANPHLPGPFKFEIAGHTLARIDDPSDPDPHRWPVTYLDLSRDIPPEIKAFASTSVVHGGHVYFFPLYSASSGGTSVLGNILARIPLGSLASASPDIFYLARDGRWEKQPTPERTRVVLDAAVSEMSVRYHPESGQWLAVYMGLEKNGDRLLYRTAPDLEGPWSEARTLVVPIPETAPGSPRYDGNNFCYAGKEHSSFARGRQLVVTYVCNSHEADDERRPGFIRRNLFLYRPVVTTPTY